MNSPRSSQSYIQLAKEAGMWYPGMSEQEAKLTMKEYEESTPMTPGEEEYREMVSTGELPYYKKEIESNEISYQHGRRSPRRPRHRHKFVPSGPQDCPQGTYFREGYFREPTMTHFGNLVIPRRGGYVEATCARMPRGNPWWEEVHDYAQEHHVSGAVAAHELSEEMQEGLIPHEHEYSRRRYRSSRGSLSPTTPASPMSPSRYRVSSSNAFPSPTNMPSMGAASAGSFGARMSPRGSAGLGSYE